MQVFLFTSDCISFLSALKPAYLFPLTKFIFDIEFEFNALKQRVFWAKLFVHGHF